MKSGFVLPLLTLLTSALLFAATASAQTTSLAGTVLQASFVGPITGAKVEFSIYLPPGYDKSTERYPVIYQLHGIGGSHTGGQISSVPASLEAAVTKKKMRASLIIFPNSYRDSMWSDSFDLKKPAETNLIHELIPYIDSHYRSLAMWEYRVVQGFSMGGFGAAKLATKFPHVFCASVSYDGAMHDYDTFKNAHASLMKEIFNEDRSYFDMNSPRFWSERHSSRLAIGMPMRMVVGGLLTYNRSLRDHYVKLGIPVDYVETGLKHDLTALLAAQGEKSWEFISEAFPLEGYWNFDETSGSVLQDLSAHGFDGKLISSPTWTTGMRGNALEFDGKTQYVELTDGSGYPDAIGALAQGSISVWFRFHSVNAANQIHPVFYLGDGVGGSTNSSLIIEVGHFRAGSAKVYFTVLYKDKKILLCYDSKFDLVINTWHNLVVTVNKNGNTGYLNGEEMIKNALSPPARRYNFGNETVRQFFADVVNKKVAWVGRGFLGGVATQQFFHGRIDELRIYDRPLAPEEVRELYQRVAHWAEPIGNGTPGSGNFLPALVASGGPPELGNQAFGFEISNGFGAAPGLILIGSARGGIPLYALGFNLNALGTLIPLSFVLGGSAQAGVGTYHQALPIPNLPGLLGVTLHSQAIILDPGAAKSFAATRGLSLWLAR